MATTTATSSVQQYLGAKADALLGFRAPKIAKERLHLPGPDFIDRILAPSDRSPRVLGNLHRMFGTGRLRGTGYLSILPVDQGIEHSAGASFAKIPITSTVKTSSKLAIEGGCNAVASTFGVLGSVARKYAHKIPFLVKFNHNELLTYPNKADQIFFGTVKQAYDMGRSRRRRHHLFRFRSKRPSNRRSQPGLRPRARTRHGPRFFGAIFATMPQERQGLSPLRRPHRQANHLGVTIEADIIKQKLPENKRRLSDAQYGRFQLR